MFILQDWLQDTLCRSYFLYRTVGYEYSIFVFQMKYWVSRRRKDFSMRQKLQNWDVESIFTMEKGILAFSIIIVAS